MKNAIRGSLSIPKNRGTLAKTIVVNMEIFRVIKQDTMSGNTNRRRFKLLGILYKLCILCVEMKSGNTINVLHVETQYFVKL